jgi:hypothetical protein
MDSIEMMERFRQFAAADLFFTPSRTRRVSQVLLETEMVRIVLTRYECNTSEIEVDVEVSLPPLPKSDDMSVLQRFIDVTIATLEYLKRFRTIGFGLELFQDEGILIASGNLSLDVENPVFEVLRPPY